MVEAGKMLHAQKLCEMGATLTFLRAWVPSKTQLTKIWNDHGHEHTKKDCISWVKESVQSNLLAEVIYESFISLYPNCDIHDQVFNLEHFLYTHYEVMLRLGDFNVSVMRTISLLRYVQSGDMCVRGKCGCGRVLLSHVDSYHSECAVCRIVNRQLKVEKRERKAARKKVV